MSTFYDPGTIRRLAATGDAFYRGAAWILDQQDAAQVETSAEYLREYEATTAGQLERIQYRINALFDHPEVRGAIQQLAGNDADWEEYYRSMRRHFD